MSLQKKQKKSDRLLNGNTLNGKQSQTFLHGYDSKLLYLELKY